MEYEPFSVVDDGTLDTVLQCGYCGAIIHTSPEPPDDPEEDWDRLAEAKDLAEYHLDECPALAADDDYDEDDEDEDDAHRYGTEPPWNNR